MVNKRKLKHKKKKVKTDQNVRHKDIDKLIQKLKLQKLMNNYD